MSSIALRRLKSAPETVKKEAESKAVYEKKMAQRGTNLRGLANWQDLPGSVRTEATAALEREALVLLKAYSGDG